MWQFTKDQKTYNIAGIEIGGQPWERSTVLIGSIFFAGDKLVQDPIKGIFDKVKVKDLLEKEEEKAKFTGNPRFIDVIGETTEALIRYIEFVASCAPIPIILDSPSQKVRIETIKHFADTNIMPRLIYNSIGIDHTDEELKSLKECGVENAILLAFSMKAMKPLRKIELLENDLIQAAKSADIENILIDTGVMDVASVSWASLAIQDIKERFGYPTGCAPANAIYTWEKMKAMGKASFQAAASSILSITRLLGADFCFYGPIKNSTWVYPAIASTDGMIAYGSRLKGLRPITNIHPLFRIF
ncbi:MAG: tetrahydromethanopterin S-methyltransferase subunit H [Candidatus Hermodarchaeota archaeon]